MSWQNQEQSVPRLYVFREWAEHPSTAVPKDSRELLRRLLRVTDITVQSVSNSLVIIFLGLFVPTTRKCSDRTPNDHKIPEQHFSPNGDTSHVPYGRQPGAEKGWDNPIIYCSHLGVEMKHEINTVDR